MELVGFPVFSIVVENAPADSLHRSNPKLSRFANKSFVRRHETGSRMVSEDAADPLVCKPMDPNLAFGYAL